MKFFRSLLAKYMLIILLAIFLVQIAYLLIALFVFGIAQNMEGIDSAAGRMNATEIEEKWHREASQIEQASEALIHAHFSRWQEQFPEASMFWIDERGSLLAGVNLKEQLPAEWTPAFTAKFIKERYGGNPFTVIAFVGADETKGFIVFEIPRSFFNPPLTNVYEKYGVILFCGVIVIIAIFVSISFLFFRGIRKRLLKLQEAMEIRDVDGLPIQTDVKKNDEIGQLEETFNQMVFELKESKQREQQEEQLRRELIANLSHDLRTPLTKIRAQTYSIAKEELSASGKQAIKALEAAIIQIDRLMENLMSYTLLMASKYTYEPKEIDVVRFVRASLASWYPAFEKEGFEVDVSLHSLDEKWLVDPVWLNRILDNLFQNVLRHSRSGKYIGVKTEAKDAYEALIITDRGKGMKHTSNEKGAGIGLSIVDMMVKGMELDWEIETNEQGTMITIKRYK